ncbi:R3H domain-containing protein [Drosera capensis]
MSQGVIELEPMNSYNRLLLHRLAEIFGFDHQSVGEGEDRHLVLEQCPETSIPSVLVSDILWQDDTPVPPGTPPLVLRRHNTSAGSGDSVVPAFPVLKSKVPSRPTTLEEREEAYLAARERIFSMDGELKEVERPKPRHDPVVARRMITHALGKRIKQCSLACSSEEQEKHENASDVDPKGNELDCSTPSRTIETHKVSDKRSPVGTKPRHREDSGASKTDARLENLGAARRMFANALGIPAARDGPARNRRVKSPLE